MPSTVRKPMTAASLMKTEVVSVKPTATLHEACETMLANRVGGLPVIDAHRRCIGILTTTDIVRFLETTVDGGSRRERFTKYFDPQTQTWEYALLGEEPPTELTHHEVSEAMSRPVVFVTPDMSIRTVARRMRRERCHRILVLDEGHFLKGIISSFDFVGLAAREDDDD